MAVLPDPIASLIGALNKLPGIGPRSAERIALHLVQAEAGAAKQLAEAILDARQRVQLCSVCGALTEKSPGTFQGKYHVLGGKISPLNGVEPEDLRIAELEQRLAQEPITELIIALGTDVEGDATSFYLAKRLARRELRITRIAHGLPAGTGLEYADELTLSRALEGRRELK